MKTQMRFQRIISLVTLVISALSILYGAIFCTPIYHMSKQTTAVANYDKINGDKTYELCQSVNGALLAIGVVFILLVAFLYFCASNKRRNYYITNYISVIATAAFAAIVGLLIIILTLVCHLSFINDVDWDTFRELASDPTNAVEFGNNVTIWVIGYVFGVIVLANAGLLIYNLIWKIKLMKGEKELLAGGLVKEVA